MIKQLITDIAYDNIKLSQAITRAKLIENKIKNETFKNWLKKELEGYEFNDKYLPDYRKVWSVINLTAEFPFGKTQTFPVSLPDNFGEKILDTINFHRIIEPISIVEQQIESLDKPKGYISIPPKLVEMLAKLFKDPRNTGVIRTGSREITKAQYQNVLEQTKQKLLDTLMELENEFPNLINEYSMTTENNDRVQNIITNNIYGNNNPTNIASGINVEQAVNTSLIKKEDEDKLKELGVGQTEIDELKQIVLSNSNDKPTLTSKAMKWLGGVSASVAGRGFYENIPQITDYITKLIN